jgi:hypothetical protein
MHLASSAGCENQAFIYNGRVLGLQFHLESTEESVQQIVQNCKTEIVQAEYIQSADEILAVKGQNYSQINNAMFGILDRLPK